MQSIDHDNHLEITRKLGCTSIKCARCGWQHWLHTDDAKTMERWERDIKKEHGECGRREIEVPLGQRSEDGQLLLIENKEPYFASEEDRCPPLGMGEGMIRSHPRFAGSPFVKE